MTTNTLNVNFKLKADDKRLMESACRELGMSMSAAFTIFAKKLVVSVGYRLRFRLTPFTHRRIFPVSRKRLGRSKQIESSCFRTICLKTEIKQIVWSEESEEDYLTWQARADGCS